MPAGRRTAAADPNNFHSRACYEDAHRSLIRPSLEILEARDNPAGTVTATFAGGRLTLTGDAANNVVRMNRADDGRLILTNNGSDTLIRLNKDAAGEVTLRRRSAVGDHQPGDGADLLFIDGVTLPGSLSIGGGNGQAFGPEGNYVYLQNVHIGGNLGITNLAGADSTTLWGTVTVLGGLTVRNGIGGSNVLGDQTTNLRVGAAFSVAGGAGFDKVDLFGAAGVAVGGLAFDSGSDGDGSYYRVHPFGDLTVTGGVQVTNGAGEDRNQLGGQNMTIRGAVVIRTATAAANNLLTQGGMSLASSPSPTGRNNDNGIHSLDDAIWSRRHPFVNGAGQGLNYVGDGNRLSVGGDITFINRSARAGPQHDLRAMSGLPGQSPSAAGTARRHSVAADTRLSIEVRPGSPRASGKTCARRYGQVVHDTIRR